MIDLSKLLARLAEMPSFADTCVHRIPPTHGAIRPSLGSFSLIENVCHLRDVDREGYAIRVARLMEEVLPDLPDVDGDALAVARNYQSQDLELALRQFARARAYALETLHSLSGQDLVRRATWGAFGVVTFAEVLERWIAHDDGHRAELSALTEAFGDRP